MDYTLKNIEQLHKAYLEKETSPLVVVKQMIAKLEANKDNLMEADMFASALDMAEKLSKEEVEKDNLLWGVPFLIKDNLSTKGTITTGGSNILANFVPLYDANVVEKLKKLKAIPLAKTTLDELGMGGSGTTGHKGVTYNPYDESHLRQVGGSSAGSAAGVSAGIVPFALGSDTGDSIRKPASYTGLVGLKPTWSRISRYGLFPFSISLDTVGFFSRNVKDAALLLSVLAGHDEKDNTSSKQKVDDYLNIDGSIKGVKVAVIRQISQTIKDSHLKAAFDKSINSLKEQGAIINFVDVDINLLYGIHPTYFIISSAEATSNNASLDGVNFGNAAKGDSYIDIVKATRTNGFGKSIKTRFVLGSYSLKKANQEEVFRRAQKARGMIVRAINQVLEENDVIYLPAAPSIAPFIVSDGKESTKDEILLDNHLAIANFAGLPSITIPLTLKDKMPIGVNFTGRAFEEKVLLNIALALEKTTGLKDLTKETL